MTMLENDGSIRQIVPHFLDSPEKALARRAFLARLGLAEFRQQFLLPRGELRRCLDVDLDDEVAVTAAVEHRHTGAALAELLARLDARGDRDIVLPAVEARNGDLAAERSEEHTSELQSLMRISYDVFCLKKKKRKTK